MLKIRILGIGNTKWIKKLRGNVQSPHGSLARISTRPYLKLNFPFVLNREDTMGGRISPGDFVPVATE